MNQPDDPGIATYLLPEAKRNPWCFALAIFALTVIIGGALYSIVWGI